MMKLLYILIPCFTFLAIGCTTPQSLMKKSLSRGTEKEEISAIELIDFAVIKENKAPLRSWALRSVSRLNKIPIDSLNKVGTILTDGEDDETVRGWAAYALGEWRRKESASYFIGVLHMKDQNAEVVYFAMEGLAKIMPAILADTELAEKTVDALMKLMGHQKGTVPSLFALVQEYVSTLAVMAVTLDKANADNGRNPDEMYASVYYALSMILVSKDKFVTGFKENESSLSTIFTSAYKSLDRKYQPLFLMVAWFTGQICDNRELSSIAAEKLAALLNSADPRLRLITAWGLTRMDVFQTEANKALVSRITAKETNAEVLRLLGVISNTPGRPDMLQKMFHIETKTEKSQ